MSFTPRKSLSSMLSGSAGSVNTKLLDAFDKAKAADDFAPLPKGSYRTIAISGKLFESEMRRNLPNFACKFQMQAVFLSGPVLVRQLTNSGRWNTPVPCL